MFNSTELFCVIDDFFLKFEATYWKVLKQCRHTLRIRASQLTISEISFIAIWYKCSHFNNFKAFFSWLKQDKNHLFKSLPCYQRMIHLINTHQLALHVLHVALMKDQSSQYLWIDSTSLPVCKNQRIQRHKSLVRIASRGKSSMGWFYGCKLHVVMNQFGEITCSALSKPFLNIFSGILNVGADGLGTYTVCGDEWAWIAFAIMTSLIFVLLSFAMLFVGGALLAVFVINRIVSAIAMALLNYMLSTIKSDAINAIRRQCA